jgi:hypothetical protein
MKGSASRPGQDEMRAAIELWEAHLTALITPARELCNRPFVNRHQKVEMPHER